MSKGQVAEHPAGPSSSAQPTSPPGAWDVACAARLWAPLRPDIHISDPRRGREFERFRLFVDSYGLNDSDRLKVADGVRRMKMRADTQLSRSSGPSNMPRALPCSTPPSIRTVQPKGVDDRNVCRGTIPAGDHNRSSAPPSVEGGGAAGPPARPFGRLPCRPDGRRVRRGVLGGPGARPGRSPAAGRGADRAPGRAGDSGEHAGQQRAAGAQRCHRGGAGRRVRLGGGPYLVEPIHPGGRVHHRGPAAATGPAPG